MIKILLVMLLSAVVVGQSDPSTLPLLQLADLQYKGGFKFSSEHSNNDNLSGGGQGLAFNPVGPSIFVASFKGNVGEFTIPTPVNSPTLSELPTATYKQGLTDITQGRLQEAGGWGVLLSSLVVQNGKLFGTASMYYDANNVRHWWPGCREL